MNKQIIFCEKNVARLCEVEEREPWLDGVTSVVK